MAQGTSFQRGTRRLRGRIGGRSALLSLAIAISVGLIALGQIGLLAPIESLLAAPLNALSGIFNRAALNLSGGVGDLAEIQSLQRRNAELEEALARFQSELVELREIESDYRRLSDLLAYTSSARNQRTLTADVIGYDANSVLRTIIINRGTRDGVAVGMPVVTEQGLVGRVIASQSNAAQVLLVNDVSSAVSARLQTTRAQGTVRGQESGNLLLTFIPLGSQIQVGDLVITSGLGGNFPADITIGQVTSISRTADLYQEAQVRSLIDFNTLELVLVITSFQPVDISSFGTSTVR